MTENQPTTSPSGQPVIAQKAIPNARIHILGDKLYVIFDVIAPGLMSNKIDHAAYLTSQGDKFVEVPYNGTGVIDQAATPLINLGTAFRPRVDSSVMNVVNNLLATQPSLAPYAAWQIDYAHREWAASEDFHDESLIIRWIPVDCAESKLKYQSMQLGDRNRAITDLENYISSLRRQLAVAQGPTAGQVVL